MNLRLLHRLTLLTLVAGGSGCLERITASPPELDPRFYREDEGQANDAGGNETLRPFASYKGTWVKLRGTIQSDQTLPVDLDLWSAKPDDPGKREHMGKIPLPVPGPFEIEVPQNQGWLLLEACHDLTGDGPTNDDPFGQVMIQVGAVDIEETLLALVPGARGVASQAGGGSLAPFSGYEGEKVTIQGQFVSDRELPIALDLWTTKADSPGTRTHLGKIAFPTPGPFEILVPKDHGVLILEASHDLTDDGPTDDDSFGQQSLEVKAENIQDLRIELVAGGKAAAAQATGTAGPRPFSDWKGEWVYLRGSIDSDQDSPVNVDFWQAQADAPGNRLHLGKLTLERNGPFEIQVPRGFGPLQLEANHDLSGDGPTNDDPFAQLTVEVQQSDLQSLVLALKIGGRGQPSQGEGSATHTEAPPGAPGGSPQPGAGGQGGEAQPWATTDPFASYNGPRVRVSGRLIHEPSTDIVDFDFFQSDPSGPGGRSFVGKAKRLPGEFEFQIPSSLKQVSVDIFIDSAGDGPTPGDPFISCPCNPIVLSNGDIGSIEISL